jgi:nitrate reductase gamma subunit
MTSALLAAALLLAAAAALGGICRRVWRWAATPEPFRIPTTTGQQPSIDGIAASRVDSPSTRAGVVGRMAIEMLLFRSLFRHTAAGPGRGAAAARLVYAERKGLWLGAMAFHWSLLVVAVRHLRLVVDPAPRAVAALSAVDGFLEIGAPRWYAADVVLAAALVYLLGRRIANPLLRYLTLPADYLALAALLAVAGSGIVLRYVARPDLVAVREFTLSVAALAPRAMAAPGFWLTAHLLSAALLLVMLPATKMAHAAGAWFSPTRNQANDSRRRLHVNPWNAPAPFHRYEEWESEFRDKLAAAGIPTERPRAQAAAGPPAAGPAEGAGTA